MFGKLKKTCRANMHGSHVCDCGNAHDSKGKRAEKRLVKRQEKRRFRRELDNEDLHFGNQSLD